MRTIIQKVKVEQLCQPSYYQNVFNSYLITPLKEFINWIGKLIVYLIVVQGTEKTDTCLLVSDKSLTETMKKSNYLQTLSLLRMYKTFNPIHFKRLVSDDVIYKSSFVFYQIEGKNEVLIHLENKLRTIKEGVVRGMVTLKSQLVVIEGISDQYFIQLNHTIDNNDYECLITVYVKEDGLIRKILITPINPYNTLIPLKVL